MKKTKSNPESRPLRVLILEDNLADSELIERELRRAGIIFTSRLIKGKREFSKALADFQPQVILSDFKLPIFDGLAALKITRLLAPDVPFIFVSGSIGEEKAIEMLAQGASDYILKDNLQRLGPAVKRVIEATCLKLEKKKSDEELQRHVDELQLLSKAADRFVNINDLDELYDYLAQTIRDLSGADYLLLSLYDEKLQAVRPKMVSGFEPFQETIRRRFHIDLMEMVFYFKDMRQDDFSDFVSRRFMPVRDGLYGLANRKIPRSICRLIEKLLAVGSMHTMGFSWENQLFGGLTVFFKKANELKNASQIEAMANLAAVSIKRLLAEQALRESEKKYRTLVTQSPDGIFVIDLQGNFLSVNQAMCAGLKYSEEEFLSLKIWDIVPEQYMDLYKKRLAAILKGETKNEAAEYMVRGKDGEIHYIAILSAPFYKDNALIGFQGIARDITKSKKMEIRLRESEEYYRILVETSPDAIIIVDAGGRVTFASRKAREIFGVPAQTDIKGIPITNFVEPGEIPRVQERLVEILSAHSLPETREYRLLRQDRRPFWGEISSSPLRDAAERTIGLLLVCRDVSERKLAETIQHIQYEIANAVVKAETFFSLCETVRKELSALLDTTNFLIALYDEASGMLSAPFEKDEKDTIPQWPAEKSLTGLVLKQKRSMLLRGEEIRQLDQTGTTEVIGSQAEAWLGVPLQINEKVLGAIVVQSYDNADAYDQNSVKIMEMIASQLSVYIERKGAEEELLREKAFLEKLVESAPEGIAITDCPGRILQVNNEFVNMFGYEVDEAVGKKIDDLLAPYEYLAEAGVITQSVGIGEPIALETVRKRKDGTLINVSIIGAPILIAEQQVAVYAIYRDISDRKEAEEAFLREKAFLEQLVESAPEAIALGENDGRILRINSEFCRLFGYKEKEVLGKNIDDLISSAEKKSEAVSITQTVGKGEKFSLETVRRRKNGKPIDVSLIGSPIIIDGQQVATYGIYRDISDRMLAEKALQDAHDRLAATIKAVPDLLFEVDRSGRIYDYHAPKLGALYVTPEKFLGKTVDDILPAEAAHVIHEALNEAFQNGSHRGAVYKLDLPDGPAWFELSIASKGEAGRPDSHFVATARDISERKQAEERVRASLKEKEVLLQEIHHRVKNNLQIISGLLTLQADQSAGKSLAEIFQASQDRIHSIALIHEKLYKSHNLAEIAFDEYLHALTENLFRSHGIAAGRITARYEMEPILFTIEEAIPLGLIVNELVTNALKYAFPAGRQGEICITLHECRDMPPPSVADKSHPPKSVDDLSCPSGDKSRRAPTYELVVADNGVGLPAGQITEQQKSLGMKLVSMLGKQIQAELEVKTGPGTEFRLLFSGLPANEAAKDKEHGG